METLAILGLVAGVAVAALVAATIIWWGARRIGRATGLDRTVDRLLETEGDGLSPADEIKFREQHPHGGAP